jgi:hypothetical protein
MLTWRVSEGVALLAGLDPVQGQCPSLSQLFFAGIALPLWRHHGRTKYGPARETSGKTHMNAGT